MSHDRLLRALRREPVDVTPVWLMRQAGRYLPEYRKLREQAGSFLDLCQNPELACEVTLQPLRRFELDGAILFSDILTIPEAMGLGLHFVPGEGPNFHHPVRTPDDIAKLTMPDMEDSLGYVPAAVRLIRRELDGKTPLIGFAGSPWTLATYMVEGGPSKTYQHIKALMYNAPEALHQLMDLLARSVAAYLNAQIAAGAQAVQIFDTWGGVLTPSAYREFSLTYMQRIVE
ncbi:uroporphyrinogen decarboxylase, partial [Salinisphaera sp.]|uniref:uroporphyrinogen decarboxylase n=1 Tax=Salinisphaera sp. TaxID=1914330 RepID=UPI000C5BE787